MVTSGQPPAFPKLAELSSLKDIAGVNTALEPVGFEH